MNSGFWFGLVEASLRMGCLGVGGVWLAYHCCVFEIVIFVVILLVVCFCGFCM